MGAGIAGSDDWWWFGCQSIISIWNWAWLCVIDSCEFAGLVIWLRCHGEFEMVAVNYSKVGTAAWL